MTIKDKARAAAIASLAGSLALVLSCEVFDLSLIRYWEWRHQGRRMMFTLWADLRAIPLALMVFLCVLFTTYRLVKRRSKGTPGE